MKILAVTSGKGGVGKSTITLNIARQLSLAGKRVLIADFDIHNKGITGLFLPFIRPQNASVTQIVHESQGFKALPSGSGVQEEALVPVTSDGRLLLLPASQPQEMILWERFHAENELIIQFFIALFERLAADLRLDVIVIDCYGGIDSLTVAASGIADDTIIVNEPDLITFSGTLQLYVYLKKQYAESPRKPRLHFLINRVTSRHSFAFLDAEYRKHLANLAIDDKILAYFPYDKLLIETFGDYPFFSELLAHGLFTKKIRLLIDSLWMGDPSFRNFSGLSEKQKTKVFQRTIESPFADPERIIRAVVTAPFWLIVPCAMLAALSYGIGGSLHYRTIQIAFYTAIGLLIFLLAIIGFFEPVQISRWLWREATYHRRKRYLKHQSGRVYRFLMASAEGFRASLPGLIGIGFLLVGSFYFWKLRRELNPLLIWPKEIYGFSASGNYTGLRLNYHASIRPGTNMSGAILTNSVLRGKKFVRINLQNARLDYAELFDVQIVNSNLQNAHLDGSQLNRVQVVSSDLDGAHFDKASVSDSRVWDPTLKAPIRIPVFQDCKLKDADFTNARLNGTTFTNCDLRGADFSGASIFGAVFDKNEVLGAKFSSIPPREFSQEMFKQLRDGGALLELSLKDIPEPSIPIQTCLTPECEFQRAWSEIAFRMPDLIESLILKGDPKSLDEAQRYLDDLHASPVYAKDDQVQGHYLLLSLLLHLVRGQPYAQVAAAWCEWRSHRQLSNWSWRVWDPSLNRKRYPKSVLEKLDAVEALEQGKINAADLCRKLGVTDSNQSKATATAPH